MIMVLTKESIKEFAYKHRYELAIAGGSAILAAGITYYVCGQQSIGRFRPRSVKCGVDNGKTTNVIIEFYDNVMNIGKRVSLPYEDVEEMSEVLKKYTNAIRNNAVKDSMLFFKEALK